MFTPLEVDATDVAHQLGLVRSIHNLPPTAYAAQERYRHEGSRDGEPLMVDMMVHDEAGFHAHVEAWLRTPLDLGLHGVVERWGKFSQRSDDPGRTAALLTPAVVERLRVLGLRSLVVRDTGVTAVCRPKEEHRADRVVSAAKHAHALRQALLAAAADVPVAAPLRTLAERLAARHGAVTTCPLSVEARVEGGTMTATSVRTDTSTYGFEVTVRRHEPWSSGLAVRPERFADRLAVPFGRQDLQLGDPAFDRAFLVQARDEAGARAALDPSLRRALLTLAPLGDVHLDDEELTVSLPDASPDRVLAAIDAALHAFDRLAAAPYRT